MLHWEQVRSHALMIRSGPPVVMPAPLYLVLRRFFDGFYFVVLIAAVVGLLTSALVAAARCSPGVAFLWAVFLVGIGSVVPMGMLGRYHFTLMPFLCMLAGIGCERVGRAVKNVCVNQIFLPSKMDVVDVRQAPVQTPARAPNLQSTTTERSVVIAAATVLLLARAALAYVLCGRRAGAPLPGTISPAWPSRNAGPHSRSLPAATLFGCRCRPGYMGSGLRSPAICLQTIRCCSRQW